MSGNGGEVMANHVGQQRRNGGGDSVERLRDELADLQTRVVNAATDVVKSRQWHTAIAIVVVLTLAVAGVGLYLRLAVNHIDNHISNISAQNARVDLALDDLFTKCSTVHVPVQQADTCELARLKNLRQQENKLQALLAKS